MPMNDEFERLKETEKAHLRKLKELKQMLQGVRRLNTTRSTLDEMSSESKRLLDENTSLVEGFTQDAALQDARMDIALSAEQERNAAADLEAREEELRRLKAHELVRQMKSQLGTAGPAQASPSSAQKESGDTRTLSDKTIGRPQKPDQPSDATPDADAGMEKTIGRMRP
jgi:hypothetical protein